MIEHRTRARLTRAAAAAVFLCQLAIGACGSSDESPTGAPTPTPTPGPSANPSAKTVLGYYVPWDTASYDSIVQNTASLNAVSADVYAVRADGTISGATPSAILSHDASRGIATWACVVNSAGAGFDAALAQAAIVTSRSATIANMVALAQSGSFVGVNVDFENLTANGGGAVDRAAFSSFIAELAGALHARGQKLMISAPAKTWDNPGDSWSYPFDYAALGAAADLIQLMTYDQHGPGWSDPGPVAGRDWMEQCVVYAKRVIAPAKLLIGLPAYGYDWDLTSRSASGDFAWKDVAGLVSRTGATVQYEASSDSPHIAYTDANGHRHEAWFENPQSIRAKAALVRAHGLRGLSMWRLGQEDASFWQAALTGID